MPPTVPPPLPAPRPPTSPSSPPPPPTAPPPQPARRPCPRPDLPTSLNHGALAVAAPVPDSEPSLPGLHPRALAPACTVDVSCASTTKAVRAVTEYVRDGNGGGLYARVEADRVALRRELAALRAERAQLVMAREMARPLCWEMVTEQRVIVKKTAAPAGNFSALGICKGRLEFSIHAKYMGNLFNNSDMVQGNLHRTKLKPYLDKAQEMECPILFLGANIRAKRMRA